MIMRVFDKRGGQNGKISTFFKLIEVLTCDKKRRQSQTEKQDKLVALLSCKEKIQEIVKGKMFLFRRMKPLFVRLILLKTVMMCVTNEHIYFKIFLNFN